MLAAKISVSFVLSLLLTLLAYADDYFIDEYEFKWKVFEQGDLVMNIVKTEETTIVQLRSGHSFSRSYLRLSPAEAVKIAAALQQTRSFFNRHKGTDTDVSDKVQAGDYVVTFRTSAKYGFSVTIRDPSLFSMDAFSVDRAQATKLQPVLMETPTMVEFIDERLVLD